MGAGAIEGTKAQMVGKDPFDMERLAGPLRYYVGGRAVSIIEIALWDLVGKETQQTAAPDPRRTSSPRQKIPIRTLISAAILASRNGRP